MIKEMKFCGHVFRNLNWHIAKFINLFLSYCSVPLFSYTIWWFVKVSQLPYGKGVDFVNCPYWLSNVLSMVICIFVHEAGRYCSVISNSKCSVMELGVRASFKDILGCTLINEKGLDRWHLIQVEFAGGRMNIIVASISILLLFLSATARFEDFLRVFIVWNITMGITYLLLLKGSDGTSIFNYLLMESGKNIIDFAKEWLIKLPKREKSKNGYLNISITIFSVLVMLMRVQVVICAVGWFVFLCIFSILG